MVPKLSKTQKRELKNQQILKKRKEYFSLASELYKYKSELKQCQSSTKIQEKRVNILQLLKFCLHFHIEIFQDFINGNLSLFEFQEVLREKGKLRLKSLEAEHGELCAQYNSNQVGLRRLEYHRKRAYELIEVIQKQLQGVQSLHQRSRHDLGNDMEKLMNMIEQSVEFKKKPIGPIGKCITVQLPNWTGLVENILKPFIGVFLVDNLEDGNLLSKFVDKIFGEYARSTPFPPLRPDVWVTKFTTAALDIEDSKVVHDTYPTLLDILTFEDEAEEDMNTVRNFLIQYGRVEKTLLFNTQHEAFPILAERDALPKNCIVAYTLDAYKITPAPAFRTRSLGLSSCRAKMLKPTTPNLDSIVKKFRSLEAEVEHGVDVDLRKQKDAQLNLALQITNIKSEHQILKKALTRSHFVSLDVILKMMPGLSTMVLESDEDLSIIDNFFEDEKEELKKKKALEISLGNKIETHEANIKKVEPELAQGFRSFLRQAKRGQNIMRNRIYSV